MTVKIITIDGPAGSGKSTVSKLLAKKLHFLYLDTGAMYRAVALQAKRKKIDFQNGTYLRTLCQGLDLSFKDDNGINKLFIGEEDVSSLIRTPEMDMLSSSISAVKEVREEMTQLQRRLGQKGDLVAEGRDMGTVVFPDSKYKFFITADPEIRAGRRYRERKARDESVDREEVEKEIYQRDDQDSNRAIAPLRPAPDAKVIDTGNLSLEEVIEVFLSELEFS